jgi:hypothetical protein
MKQKATRTQRENYLTQAFERLTPQNQIRLDTITAQLARLHETSPESRPAGGKKPKSVLQHNKERKQ